MSRYTGHRLKIVRAFGVELPGLTRKTPNRDYGPGQNGARPRRKSGFGVPLMKRQKLRYHCVVSGRQIRRLFSEARNDRGGVTVTRLPEANEAPFPIGVQHVVEYHAVRM